MTKISLMFKLNTVLSLLLVLGTTILNAQDNRVAVGDLVWSNDGNVLAVSSVNGIYIYDTNHMLQSPHLIAEGTGAWLDLTFSSDSRLLAFGDGKNVFVWDLEDDVEILYMTDVWFLEYILLSPDNRWLFTFSTIKPSRIWDLSTGTESQSFEDGTIAISSDWPKIVTKDYGSNNFIAYAFDIYSGILTEVARFQQESEHGSLKFSPDDR